MRHAVLSKPAPARARTRVAAHPAQWMAALVIGLVVVLSGAPADARTAPDSFADLAERLLPAVVNISTTQKASASGPELPQFPPGSPFEEFFKEFFERQRPDQPQRRAHSLGSGFVIDAEEGYVVTNNHVIEDAEEVKVILHDETELPAEVVGRDNKTDLALLKIKTDHPLVAVTWGDSSTTRVGDWVLAIGNPFGLGGTVTAGIVSARARDINAGPYDDFLQTDASINRGNSGGPMFNLDGQVIGINTAIFSPSGGSIGIGFAIPSNMAKNVIDQIRRFGEPRRGWLGVRIQTVTDEIAESLGLDAPRGALVASVSDGSPAKEAGLEQGDIILSFDGQPIDEMRSLPRIVAETPIDKSVEVEIWRKGGTRSVDVTVGQLSDEDAQMASVTDEMPDEQKVEELGLSLSALSEERRRDLGLADDVKGVVVTDVRVDSAAAEKGLRPGDVIMEISQEPVETPEQIARHIAEARDNDRRSVLILFQRAGELRYVALRIDDKG